ncbi:hypothetical protein D9758_006461 [Tetrapyrgos nigripes]|uniref:Uncharacterized protein n=1 Tax=Tetrapyrgos nigripes TaxID=182062 RepID=A0A8H5GKL6_9AGAR|nr:hypothetical protein D9758_006461 [Tetrapyrgos nigripes]
MESSSIGLFADGSTLPSPSSAFTDFNDEQISSRADYVALVNVVSASATCVDTDNQSDAEGKSVVSNEDVQNVTAPTPDRLDQSLASLTPVDTDTGESDVRRESVVSDEDGKADDEGDGGYWKHSANGKQVDVLGESLSFDESNSEVEDQSRNGQPPSPEDPGSEVEETAIFNESGDEELDFNRGFDGLSITMDGILLPLQRLRYIFTVETLHSWSTVRLKLDVDLENKDRNFFGEFLESTIVDVRAQCPILLIGVWSLFYFKNLTSLRLDNVFFDYEGEYNNYVLDILKKCTNLIEGYFVVPRTSRIFREARREVHCPKLQYLTLGFVEEASNYSAIHILPHLKCPRLIFLHILHDFGSSEMDDEEYCPVPDILTKFFITSRYPPVQCVRFEKVPWLDQMDLYQCLADRSASLTAVDIRYCPHIHLGWISRAFNYKRAVHDFVPYLRELALASYYVYSHEVKRQLNRMIKSRRVVLNPEDDDPYHLEYLKKVLLLELHFYEADVNGRTEGEEEWVDELKFGIRVDEAGSGEAGEKELSSGLLLDEAGAGEQDGDGDCNEAVRRGGD